MRNKLLLGLALLAALPAAADDLDKIKAKGEVVIGVRENSPPFGFFDKKRGVVFGYDIEFANYVAKKLGVKPVFKTLEPAERLPAIKDGRVDLVFASLAKTSEREKEVDFSLGYFISTQKMLAKKGKFRNLTQLDNMRVCVPKGTTNAKLLQGVSSSVQVINMDDYDDTLKGLAEGKCDGASGPEATMLGNLAKMPGKQDYEVADIAIASEALAVGMRKGEKKLQKAVNEALVDAEATGEAARIFNTWFGPGSNVPLIRAFRIVY
ncbi:transporter substrate-binding domain-containing protein [Chitinimonas sp.]|uniref:transporter substrate-binding domain-containing protein n=1 Tax=Chitinimonas sp. TaxID=1934313 RepID=UPI002F9247C1